MPNEVGGMETTLPEDVAGKMKALLAEYNFKEEKTLDDILEFHVRLKYNVVPFIIEGNLKLYYYRGLKEWKNERGFLRDTCLTAQDRYKVYLGYFRIG